MNLRVLEWLGTGLMILSLVGLVVMLLRTGTEITLVVIFLVLAAILGICAYNFARLQRQISELKK